MSEPFTIKLNLDNTQGKEAVASMVGGLKSAETAAAAAANGIEKMARDAKGRFVAMGKQATETAKAMGDASQEAGKRGATTAEQEALAHEVAKQKIAAAAERLRQKNFIVATEQARHMDAMISHTNALSARFQNMTDTGVKGFNSFKRASVGAFAAGIAAARTYMHFLTEVHEKMHAQIEDLYRTKELFLELASMQGKTTTDKFTINQMKAAERAGMSKEDFARFSLELTGAGESMIDKGQGGNISTKEAERFATKSGEFATAQGFGGELRANYGKMAGLALHFKKYKTAEEAVTDLVKNKLQLDKGVGSNELLLRQEAQIVGQFVEEGGTGHIKDIVEAAILTATASVGSPRQAAETVAQYDRILTGHNEKWGSTLKKAGIKPGEQLETAGPKLFKLIEENQKKTAKPILDAMLKKGIPFEEMMGVRGEDAQTFLEKAGITNEDARKFVMMYGQRESMARAYADKDITGLTDAKAKAMVDKQIADSEPAQLQMLKTRNERMLAEKSLKNKDAILLEEIAEGNLIGRGTGRTEAAGIAADRLAGAGDEKVGHMVRLDQEMRKLAGHEPEGFAQSLVHAGNMDMRGQMAIEFFSKAENRIKAGRNVLDIAPVDPHAGDVVPGGKAPKAGHVFTKEEQAKTRQDFDRKLEQAKLAALQRIDAKLADPRNMPAKQIQANGGKPAFH
jgi:hypothetical protein